MLHLTKQEREKEGLQVDKVIEGKHLALKRVASQLQNSISSSLISPEEQIKKREENLNKKFGGIGFEK